MKLQSILSAAFFGIPMFCFAEEANPFVNQPEKVKPAPPSGESFVTLAEQILVRADQLEGWLKKNPLTDDAAGLRNVVQAWISKGSARLDHTAASTGTVGRYYGNHSSREQIYATEYFPAKPGEWSVPTAFETRNLGYSIEGDTITEKGAFVLRAKMSFCGASGTFPQSAWNELAEKTRYPDDVFVPLFRAINVERVPERPANNDPFAKPAKSPDHSERFMRFEPGKVYLACRADNDLPEPNVTALPDNDVKPAVKAPDRWVRLFFFRGAIAQSSAADTSELSRNHHVSVRLLRVNHRTFSDWLRQTDLATLPGTAWAAVDTWIQNGEAVITNDVTSTSNAGSTGKIDDIVEMIYPTEWEPGKRTPAGDGKPSQLEFSQATAFETRHVGTMLETKVIPDPQGSLLRVGLRRVADSGKSVHHRIFREGEWKVDMTFPIFSSNVWQSDLRVRSGQWMLVGSGSDIDSKGKLDPAHAVLAFVKVE